MRRLENILPGRTILQMEPSFPIRDFSWRFVHVRFWAQEVSKVVQSLYFVVVISMVMLCELMAMPRYVM